MNLDRKFQAAWSLAIPAALGLLIAIKMAPNAGSHGGSPTPLARPAITPTAPPRSITFEPFPPLLPEVGASLPLSSLPEPHALLPVEAGAPPGSADRPSPRQGTVADDPRLIAAMQRLADGEVTEAQTQLRHLANDSNQPLAARARFVLGRSLLANGDANAARAQFQQYLKQYKSGPDAARARFALGEIAFRQGRRDEASGYLQQYLSSTSDHALDGYAESALAQIAQASGDSSGAIAHLRRAVEDGIPLPEELKAASTVGTALQQSGRLDDAAAWYAILAARPSNDPSTRAHYQILQAQALQQSGKSAQAVALYRRILEEGTAGIETDAVIAGLKALGQTVTDFAAGEAYLKAQQFDRAVAALGDYLDHNPSGPDAPTARLDRGRALLAQHAFGAAAAQLDRFTSLYPSDSRLGSAILLEGQALQQAGNTTQAVALLQSFARQHPSDPSAARALWDASQYLKPSSPDGALEIEKQLITSFPSSPLAPAAAFDLGWASYENLDFASARTMFQMVRDRWPTNPASTPALLWLGKMEQRAGNAAEAKRDLELAWKANPGDYYAFRARELASSSPERTDTSLAPPPTEAELNRQRVIFETWLATWTRSDPGSMGQPYLGAPISQGSTLRRIRELAEIGLEDDLDREVSEAMKQYRDDGRSLYALADVLSAAGHTTQSMAAAYRLLMISPAPNSYQSPLFLQRLVYPFPFRDLIVQASRNYGVDPLLLVSLIRQESAFDTTARSSASALGLTQFLPSTAIDVAQSIGISSFDPTDLYRPSVAIPLGAAYLASQTRAFGGNPFLALAAYNAGGGNVQSWLSDNPRHDLDLLVEEIPFQQTRDYVRNIYRFYQEYKLLYRTPSGGGDATP